MSANKKSIEEAKKELGEKTKKQQEDAVVLINQILEENGLRMVVEQSIKVVPR